MVYSSPPGSFTIISSHTTSLWSPTSHWRIGKDPPQLGRTGRISKWAVELGALTLDFKPWTAIKLQALVDFMVEW
jgi:hypothetical protein